MSITDPTASLAERMKEMASEWHDQVKEFRRLSLEATDPVEVTRMRAKADTLHYSQRELLLVIEQFEEDEEELQSSHRYQWPGLGNILNAKK